TLSTAAICACRSASTPLARARPDSSPRLAFSSSGRPISPPEILLSEVPDQGLKLWWRLIPNSALFLELLCLVLRDCGWKTATRFPWHCAPERFRSFAEWASRDRRRFPCPCP